MSAKILLIILITTITGFTQTSQWRLIWDKNAESDSVTHYEIYRDTTTSPQNTIATKDHIRRVDDGKETMEFTDSELPVKGKRIFYRLKAVNNAGSSDFSETVNAAIPFLDFPYDFYLPPAQTVEIPLADRVQDPTTSINSFIWNFGFPAGFDTSIVNHNGNPFLQIITPPSWTSGSDVSIKVTNNDEFYDSTIVQVYPDSLLVFNLDSLKFTDDLPYEDIYWKTRIPSQGRIKYGIISQKKDSTYFTDMDTIHVRTISDLLWAQVYHFNIESEDYYDIATSTGDYTFKTPPEDDPPVNIYDIRIESKGSDYAEISWKTTPETRGYIEYGTTTGYGKSTLKDLELNSSSRQLIEGLEDSTTYHFRIVAESEEGISGRSNDSTFTTIGWGPPEFNVYPIPLELSNPLHNKRIVFEDFPVGSGLYIFNLLGDLVYKKTNIQSVPFHWPAVNNANRRVHTGVYLYVLKSPSGKNFAEGKVIVIY